MEKNLNPNSWSDLPLDLVNSVFERLGFADFQRAKSVCSPWHSASRQSVPKKSQFHWLILFPEDNDNNNNYSCRLLNPEEKDKLYKTQDLGLEFARSVCIRTYGSWLLKRDPLYNLHIVNLFTQERINLPPTESQLGKTKVKRARDGAFLISSLDGREHKGIIRSPVFWIDEKTKDYVVLWGLQDLCVLYSKKGDTSWNEIPETSRCCNMVYKDHRLYLLSSSGCFKILDFSGGIPQQTFHGCVNVDDFPRSYLRSILRAKLVVTVTGQVLKVVKSLSSKGLFRGFQGLFIRIP